MKNRGLYIVCRILNWVLPILILCNVENEKFPFLNVFGYYVLFMYVFYFGARMLFEHTRSRWLYEVWIFIFAGAAIRALVTNDLWVINLIVTGFGLSTDGSDISLGDKTICIAFCVFVILSKIIALIYQTKEYRAGADERRENLLNEKIEVAEYAVDVAKTSAESSAAKARLRRALHHKERWDQRND